MISLRPFAPPLGTAPFRIFASTRIDFAGSGLSDRFCVYFAATSQICTKIGRHIVVGSALIPVRGMIDFSTVGTAPSSRPAPCRPSTSSLVFHSTVVDGRAKPGHDGKSARSTGYVNLFDPWY